MRVLHFFELKLNNRDPVYLQMALYVKRKILLRQAEHGDKLPSRREIAAQLQVNPNTVQKAFRLMEEEGYVRTSSTLGSIIHVDEEQLAIIEKELTRGLVKDFVESAREIRLSFRDVVGLLGEVWDETDERNGEERD